MDSGQLADRTEVNSMLHPAPVGTVRWFMRIPSPHASCSMRSLASRGTAVLGPPPGSTMKPYPRGGVSEPFAWRDRRS